MLKQFAGMRRFALIAAFAAALAALAMLAGCQTTEPAELPSQKIETETSDVAEGVPTEPFYVLLVGNDSRTGTVEITKSEYADGNARSDTMMLARIDPQTYKVTLITVPRDTTIDLNGSPAKLNNAYQAGGIEASVEQVELLTGVKIDYYFDLGFVTFQKFVDALGGLSVNVPINMNMQDIVSGNDVSVAAGQQDLNGAEALVVARTRKAFATDQDACRQIQDRALVAAAITKVAQDSGMIETAVSAMMDNAETNMSADILTELVTSFASNADKLTIYQATGPYGGDINPTTGEWLATRDEATWQQIIATADAGEDPSGIVALPQIVAAG